MQNVKIRQQTETTATITGYTVIFGGKDLQGETFNKNTEFYLDNYQNVPLFYDHSMGTFKHKIGNVKSVTADEVGLFVEAELDKSADYVEGVLRLIGADVVGMSSGTLSHIAQRKNTDITTWPLGEVSLTVIPAEHRTIGHVQALKTLAQDDSLKALLSEVADEATVHDATVETTAIEIVNDYSTNGDTTMSEEKEKVAFDERMDAMEAKFTAQIGRVVDFMESSPAMKRQKAVAPDSETDHAEVKSFGDWLVAVKRGNMKRLTQVYGTKFEGHSTKDVAELGLTTGGALVPDTFHAQLLQIVQQQSRLYNLVTRQMVPTVSGTFPSLDNYTAVTANVGNSPFSGGVSSAYTAEGATLTETQPTFKDLSYRLNKVGGYVEVSNEMISDSAVAMEGLLMNLFGIADANKIDHYILNGSGVGEPLGFLNSPAAIGVAPANNNVFAIADALAIYDRFYPFAGGAPVWFIPPGMMNEIALFETTAGGGIFQANIGAGMTNTLYGYPLVQCMHMPAPNSDDVLLIDPKSYILFEQGGLMVDFSEHAAFTSDKGTWRFKRRMDGKMWLNSAVTPSNGGSTLSPAVYHADAP